ncbi:MAG: hypothetical protein QN183_13830 [Armatimonadota bacterium]|nr:hypothetical protein [Armatimonadota bacterium]
MTADEIREREVGLAMRALHDGRDPLRAVVEDRRMRYAEHVRRMGTHPAIAAWAQRMTARTGRPAVLVWGRGPWPWPQALLVVRYGESEHAWPATWSDDDVARALRWESGEVPVGVHT